MVLNTVTLNNCMTDPHDVKWKYCKFFPIALSPVTDIYIVPSLSTEPFCSLVLMFMGHYGQNAVLTIFPCPDFLNLIYVTFLFISICYCSSYVCIIC